MRNNLISSPPNFAQNGPAVVENEHVDREMHDWACP